MTAALLMAEPEAVGGRVSLRGRGHRLVIATPLGAAPPNLIAPLRSTKPALAARRRDRCAQRSEPERPRPLLPIGTADEGHPRRYGRAAGRRAAPGPELSRMTG